MRRTSRPVQIVLSSIGIVFAGIGALICHTVLDDGYLFVSDSGVDLGTYPSGAEIHHYFKVWNMSGHALKIEKVATSCTCTVASLTQSEIKPFSCTSAVLTIDTSRQGLGRRMRGVTMSMKDGKQVSEMVYFTVR